MLALTISFTLTLYLLAIEYNVSPCFTVYKLVKVGDSVSLGIINLWPIDRLFVDKLLASFIWFTVKLNFLAMPHKVSPAFTI